MIEENKPREKLLANGSSSLSDEELMAVILGTGTKDINVFKLASRVLPLIDRGNDGIDPIELTSIKGLGFAKACAISAAYEFFRRRVRPHGLKVRHASDIIPLVSHLAARMQEHFVSISLNGAHEVIATRVITIGLVNSSQIHPREVFSELITDRASAVIVAHNHPSGNLAPSDQDRDVTKRLKTSGELLGIHLLDHVIFSTHGFVSFKEEGWL